MILKILNLVYILDNNNNIWDAWAIYIFTENSFAIK